MKSSVNVLLLVVLASISASSGLAQNLQTPYSSPGQSPDAVYDESNVDSPNLTNGNLSLSIPFVSFPQRGHQLHLSFRIFYNDQRWFISNYCDGYDTYTQTVPYPCSTTTGANQWTWTQYPNLTPWPSNMGVFVSDDIHVDFGQDESDAAYYGNDEGGGNGYQQFSVLSKNRSSFVAETDGAKHYFADSPNYQANGNEGAPSIPYFPSNLYPTNDGSGYLTTSAGFLGKDGNSYTATSVTDPAGNAITLSNGWVDSIGRTIPGSSSGPGTGSTTQAVIGGGLTVGPSLVFLWVRSPLPAHPAALSPDSG